MRKVRQFLALAPHRSFATAARAAGVRAWPARLTLALALAVAPALAGGAGCDGGHDHPPEIKGIDPSSAYNDTGVVVSVLGLHFRPPLDIDTHTGTAGVDQSPVQIFVTPVDPAADPQPVEARGEQWRGDHQIDAGLPAGLPAGDYRVELRDGAGTVVTSDVLFTSLGPDNDAPRITFLQPRAGTTVAPETWVSVVAMVEDGQGQVKGGHWCARSPTLGCTPGECVMAPDRTCRFSFMAPMAPTLTEQIDVELEVVDSRLNPATAILPIQVAWRPEIISLTPSTGPTSGGTQLAVEGTRLAPGFSRILVDDRSIGGSIDGNIIRAVTQPHAPGVAFIAIGNGDGDSASESASRGFVFVAPPTIKVIDPIRDVAGASPRITVAGDYFSLRTRFFWRQDGGPEQPIEPAADENLVPPPYAVFQTEHRYIIKLPPASGVIALRAHDDIGGDSVMTDAFTFDPPP